MNIPTADTDVREQSARTCADAAFEVNRVSRAAGLSGFSAELTVEGPVPMVALSAVDAETAVEIAQLIRKGTKRAYKTVDALRAVFDSHGLDVPDLDLDQGQVQLGDVSVSTADALARFLGAPPQDIKVGDGEWPEAQQTADRLRAAFKTVTGGGFLDPTVHPDCLRCGALVGLSLDAIDLRSARRLLVALRSGGPT
ncbi:hypothetical protein [Streptomyces sp. NPDC006645]|uniref:hypothetical protein n=1 Tax=unclassified Streptomyces TaxID=2593676 RepID=UPI0033B013DE